MRRLPGLHSFLLLIFLAHVLGLWAYGLWAWPVGTALIAAVLLFVMLRYWPEEGGR